MNVLLVDDHASVRQALAFVFEREPDCTVVAQADSLEEARNLLNNVDVAVVDLDLPGSDGFAMVRELCSANPRSTILGLTASAERKWVALAVEAGAAGVLHKSVRVSDIIQAMRRLNAGDQLFSPAETVELLRLASRQREEDREAQLALDRLTPRERAVLQQLAEGLNDKEIAQRLHISSGTVHSHMVSILRKLAVESRLQALVFAVRHGAVTIA